MEWPRLRLAASKGGMSTSLVHYISPQHKKGPFVINACKKIKGFYLSFSVNPLRPTPRWTDAHFCRFLTVLEYSPIGEKFVPTIAPRTLYTVQKKNGKFSKLFLF
jgi:hypothetical protein